MSNSNCATDSAWAPTPAAYAGADTDNSLRQWWNGQAHGYFARQLAESFGDHPRGFDCGIGKAGTCTISGCDAFSGDPTWTYQALMSVVNLDTYMNAIFNGVLTGQVDFTNSINQIALTFFAPDDSSFPLDDATPWLTAIITILFAIGLFLAPGAEFVGIATGAVAVGGLTMGNDKLQPSLDSSVMSVTQMENYARTFGEETRDMLSHWANSTFRGMQDSNNQTILDYLNGGSFVDSDVIPDPGDVEDFYTKQMISRTINGKWRKKPIFAMFSPTDDPEYDYGPNQTKYYSEEDRGVYYIYQFYDEGRLKARVDKPERLDELNGTFYNINGSDITKSSAKSFRAGRFNYTAEIDKQQLQNALTSNNTVNPFTEGAGWIGTWTIPVCEIGRQDWIVQYGKTRFPCCCGTDCKDTKDFVEAANLKGSQTLLRACSAQLAGGNLEFGSIDYGFGWSNSFQVKWWGWNDGIRAGVTLAFIALFFSLISVLLCCCCFN